MGNYLSSQQNLEEQLCELCYSSYRRQKWWHGPEEYIPSVARSGHPLCLQALIAATNEHKRKSVCQDALKMAAPGRNVACVKILVEAGADVNDKDYYGTTPLARAVKGGHEECVEFLLSKGADVKLAGLTTLMDAIHFEHTKCVSVLIEAGADVNTKGKEGNTALIIASSSCVTGRIGYVQLLLRSGAKVNVSNNKKLNALCSHISKSKDLNKPPDRTMVLLLYAAGETLDGMTIDEDDGQYKLCSGLFRETRN